MSLARLVGRRGPRSLVSGRKKRANWLLLPAALLLIAGGGVYVLQASSVPIVVAARDIPEHTRLTAADLRVSKTVKGGTQAIALATSVKDVVGRYAAVSIPSGEAIAMTELVSQPASGAAIVNGVSVPDGMVEVSAPLLLESSVAGRLKGGDHVQLLALPAQSTQQQTRNVVKLVASNVLVVRVDNGVSDASGIDLVAKVTTSTAQGATMVVTFAASPAISEQIAGLGAARRLAAVLPTGDSETPPDSVNLD